MWVTCVLVMTFNKDYTSRRHNTLQFYYIYLQNKSKLAIAQFQMPCHTAISLSTF